MIGIDTVRLTFTESRGLVSPSESLWTEELRPTAFIRKTDGPSTQRLPQVMRSDSRTGARVCRRHDGSGWVEASLPRFIAGTNVAPLEVGYAPDVVRELLDFVGLDGVDQLEIARLDVAGDWKGEVTPWRAALLQARWPGSKALPQAEMWSTTIGRHGHNQIQIYDKGIESGGDPDEHGRCEVRTHSVPDNITVHDFRAASDFWCSQVARISGNSLVLDDCPVSTRCLVYCAQNRPELIHGIEALMRASGSRSMLTRFRQVMRSSLQGQGKLGSDLIEMVLSSAA